MYKIHYIHMCILIYLCICVYIYIYTSMVPCRRVKSPLPRDISRCKSGYYMLPRQIYIYIYIICISLCQPSSLSAVPRPRWLQREGHFGQARRTQDDQDPAPATACRINRCLEGDQDFLGGSATALTMQVRQAPSVGEVAPKHTNVRASVGGSRALRSHASEQPTRPKTRDGFTLHLYSTMVDRV